MLKNSLPKLISSPGIFNSGTAIKDGIIDINKTYDMIQKIKLNQPNPNTNPFGSNPKLPIPNNGNLTEEEKFKWNEIMKFFKQNPNMLLEMMPDSMYQQDADIKSYKTLNMHYKALSRKGKSMIPDLGVVPPQSSLSFNSYQQESMKANLRK